jgi:hypothetical protein
MSVQDTITDELIAYCLDNPGKINAIRAGTLTVEIRDHHVLAVRMAVEERMGYEIDRDRLGHIIARLKHRSDKTD